jgi:heme/copper-type cytochrome/quinol oxidase subunit 1
VFFSIVGTMAPPIRVRLVGPGQNFVPYQVGNDLFTMYGTIMRLLLATLVFVGLANIVMPLSIGTPDVAFPPMNPLSYHLCSPVTG